MQANIKYETSPESYETIPCPEKNDVRASTCAPFSTRNCSELFGVVSVIEDLRIRNTTIINIESVEVGLMSLSR